MKLRAIQATKTTPHLIEIYDNKDNKFAAVSKFGDMRLFGEDEIISREEMKSVCVIADNFDLFFNNIKTL